jgi:predicted SAM-dependent methyltransferase
MVLTSHVMEHFNGDEVLGVLREARDLLAPGGGIVIEVPHWDLRPESPSFWSGRWRDTPHLSFFSQPALEQAVKGAGFELAYCNSYGLPRDWPQDFDTVRRKTTDWKVVKGGGAHFLLIAQSAQMRPRPRGRVLRAVGVK